MMAKCGKSKMSKFRVSKSKNSKNQCGKNKIFPKVNGYRSSGFSFGPFESFRTMKVQRPKVGFFQTIMEPEMDDVKCPFSPLGWCIVIIFIKQEKKELKIFPSSIYSP